MKYIALIILPLISVSCSTFHQKVEPPTIGGQNIPDNNITIDFTKKYDIHWKKGEETGIFRKTKIIGYTGNTVKDSQGSYSTKYSNFRSWLVIAPVGKGRIYLPPSMVSFFQESSQ